MHYTIKYDITDPKLADALALRDFREYVGEKTWAKLGAMFVQPGAKFTSFAVKKRTVQAFYFACMMIGVSGRPGRAYLRTLFALHK